MKRICLSLLLVSSIFYAQQKPVFTSATVKAATVYFNAAEITQTTNVTLPAGTHEIVVKNVANYLNENSVQIGAPSSITVLSVQFTNNYISEYEIDEKSPETKIVRDSITLVQKELLRTQNSKNSESKTIELLDKNQQISGVNSGLNVAELMKMVAFYKTKRTEISNNIDLINEKEQKLNKTLRRLNNKLEINTSKEEKSSTGKLVLQVMNEKAGNIPLEISYLTNNAGWVPFYDLKTENINEPISMIYKAQIVQNTGIDWKKVKLTLSSGQPNQNNQAPLLNAWFLRYEYTPRISQYAKNDASIYKQSPLASKDLSGYTREVEINKEKSLSTHLMINENQLNISFDIDIPYDIVSNGKKHSVTLTEIKLPVTYKYYAAPRIEKEAFLLAEIKDYSKYNLLKGEANIIFEGMYIGKTFVDPNQTSDTLSLSMGRDKKVSIKREKMVDKSGTKFLSSTKQQTFTYEITIRNNKNQPIEMVLKDQYPLSTDKEIVIELLQSDKAKVNPETGILIWNLNLKPNETKKVRLSYSVKYPKNKMIDNL